MAEKVVDNLANRILELNYRAINEGNRFVVVTPEETVDLVEKQKIRTRKCKLHHIYGYLRSG